MKDFERIDKLEKKFALLEEAIFDELKHLRKANDSNSPLEYRMIYQELTISLGNILSKLSDIPKLYIERTIVPKEEKKP